MMKPITFVLLGAVLTGCSDSGKLSPETLDGSWSAEALTAANAIDPSQQVDLMAQGLSLTLEFRVNGEFTLALSDVFGSSDSTMGAFDIVGNDITLTAEGTDITFSADRDGDVLTLSWSEVDIDWDDDGVADLTAFRAVMRRT